MYSARIVKAPSSEPHKIVSKLTSQRQELELEKKRLGDVMNDPTCDKMYKSFQSVSEPFKYARYQISDRYNTPSVTQPWLKMIEMLSHYNIIKHLRSVVREFDDITSFDNVGLPGAFVLALIHAYYSNFREANMQCNIKWYANTQGMDRDPLDLYENYKDMDRWLKASTSTAEGVESVVDWFRTYDDEVDVHFFSSDKGVELDGKFDKQEELHVVDNYGQVCCAMGILVEGGCMITKQFTVSTIDNILLIERLSDCFESLYICKPESSSGVNSEIFLVGIGFKTEEGRKLYAILLSEMKEKKKYTIKDLDHNKYLKSIYHIASILMKNQIEAIGTEISDFNDFVKSFGKFKHKISDNNKKILSEWFMRVGIRTLDRRDWLDINNMTQYQIKSPEPNSAPVVTNGQKNMQRVSSDNSHVKQRKKEY